MTEYGSMGSLKPASHPSNTLWKSIWDSRSLDDWISVFLCTLKLEPLLPQGACNGCLRSAA